VRRARSLDRLDFRQRYSRLKLVINNSRFLILPDCMFSTWGRGFCLSAKGVWGAIGKQRSVMALLLLETFVDPQRFRGTVYRAANWVYVGNTRGFRRTRLGYTATPFLSQKRLRSNLAGRCRRWLCRPILPPPYRIGDSPSCSPPRRCNPSLPSFPDPRPAPRARTETSFVHRASPCRRSCPLRYARLPSDLDWAQSLGQKSRERFGCRRQGGRYVVPSEYILRDVLIRVDPPIWTAPCTLERSPRRQDETLAIDGKTLCNASTRRVTPRM